MTARTHLKGLCAAGAALLSVGILLGGGVAGAATAPSSGSTAVSGPVTHPDADTMGSQIRLHEGSRWTALSTANGSQRLRPAVIAGAVNGMDVSNWQSNVDWTTARRNGAAFAYIKATESTTYQNSYFTQQYNGAYNAGIIRGAYHFALPDRSSGKTQADYFVNHGGGWSADGMTLPPMLDIEYNPYGSNSCYGLTPAQMASWVRDFSNEVHARTGRYPVIYTGYYWWNQCTGSNTTFGSTNPLFEAWYASKIGPLAAGWSVYTFWQYSDSGTFPGDQDVFNGSYAQLQTLARGSAAPTTTPPVTTPTPTDPITSYYNKLGGQSYAGAAKGSIYNVAGGQAQDFANGSIYYSSTTGAHFVHGAILGRYKALGGPAGMLGFPLTDQLPVGDGKGQYNHFKGLGGSSIYWTSRTGAHAVGGAIRYHWARLGGPKGFVGYPTTDEAATRVPGGRWNNFSNGVAIEWKSGIGAFEIHGAIRARWGSMRCAAGPLGFPTSDEYSVPGGRRSNFENGMLTWSAATRGVTATLN